MFIPKIYKGIVVSNNDLEKLGRLQVRLNPEFKDVPEDLLPWLRPFLYQDITNVLLEEGAQIWCFFLDDYFKQGYWISTQHIDCYFNYDEVFSQLNSISDLDLQEYPQPQFQRFSNGTIFFNNTITNDIGIFHTSKSYCMIDSSGSIILSNSFNKFSILNSKINISHKLRSYSFFIFKH